MADEVRTTREEGCYHYRVHFTRSGNRRMVVCDVCGEILEIEDVK